MRCVNEKSGAISEVKTLALTPALSPRRGRTIRPRTCCDDPFSAESTVNLDDLRFILVSHPGCGGVREFPPVIVFPVPESTRGTARFRHRTIAAKMTGWRRARSPPRQSMAERDVRGRASRTPAHPCAPGG